MIIKLRIFDKHEVQYFEDGELHIKLLDEDTEWHRFDFYLDTSRVQIDAFREYVLFDSESNPTKCTKIYLSDGSVIYGCMSCAALVEMCYTEEEEPEVKENWFKRLFKRNKNETSN